jgi:MFS transporter, UMF1 family
MSEKPSRLHSLGLDRPELRAWAMYDWANSAFLCTIITAVFPIYFAQVAAKDLAPAVATARYAGATTLALAVIAVLSPFLGALADYYAIRKKLLGFFLTIGVLSTAALGLVGPGDWLLGSVLFIFANIGASGSFVFYDSLLPHIADSEEIDRVSTAGYGLGYLGGGLLLTLNLLWIMKPDWFGIPSPEIAMRLSFVSVAIWWAIFSIPLLTKVPEPPGAQKRAGNPITITLSRLCSTIKELGRYRQALLMLVAFLIYNDGIGTIIRMANSYGSEIGLPSSAMVGAVLMVQFLGIPFTFAFGALAGKIGPKRSILIALALYAGVSYVAYRMTSIQEFFLLAVLIAVAQGGCQALSRSLFASLIPEDKATEFFGFFAVAEKFAGVAGSAIFAGLVHATGSGRLAVLSIVFFFVIGALLLTAVDVDAGRAARKVK